MLHRAETAAQYSCWWYIQLWGPQIRPLGIALGTGSFRDRPCFSCTALWHVLPGEVCKSKYPQLLVLAYGTAVAGGGKVKRDPNMGRQNRQQFLHICCDSCKGPAPGTLNQACSKPNPLPLSNSSSRTTLHSWLQKFRPNCIAGV